MVEVLGFLFLLRIFLASLRVAAIVLVLFAIVSIEFIMMI
jgi:hypothetical protein